VIDIDAEHSDAALQRLSALDATLRCRVLF
jgi:hypothetical protein